MTSHRAWNSTLPVCRKAPHANRSEAEQEIGRLKQKPETGRGEVLRAYYCPACRAWHVGHRAKPWRSGERRPGNPERPAKAAKPRKRLRSKPKKRSAEAAAMVSRGCELTRLLDFLRPRGWRGCKRAWEGHPEARTVDPHHVWQRGLGDHAWNVVAAERVAHEFVQSTRVGRLVCAWALHRRGDLKRETIRALHGRDPVGLIAVDLENGIFAGRCERLASALCRRYGV